VSLLETAGGDDDPGRRRRTAVAIFLSFAFAYFFSTLLRAITATLAPSFSADLGLDAAQLGLLGGAYFLGFAVVQLPLGAALDRFGPRRVLLALLGVAVLGCAGFALAERFVGLLLARALIGIGVSACLMAPMTAFRHGFTPAAQLRASSWMLMSGSLGMVASTVPVQWLLPTLGWRPLFWLAGAGLMLSMVGIARWVPRDPPGRVAGGHGAAAGQGYALVFAHPAFVRCAPIGFFVNGGLVAIQSLWAGPWLVQVGGWTPAEAAHGLFGINLAMLVAFLGWGLLSPRLYARGWSAERLIGLGTPLCALSLMLVAVLGGTASAWAIGLFCVSCTVASLAQPAVGQAFDRSLAGRALTAYNLVIFVGVFLLQWGIGLVIDGFRSAGASPVSAYQAAFALTAMCMALSSAWFVWRGSRSPAPVKAEAA
jgi:predicted MFS family arabinose efflux permease